MPLPASDIQGLSRRRWLGLGLGLATVAAGGWWWRAPTPPQTGRLPTLQSFNATETRTLDALATAVLPGEAPFPPHQQAEVLTRLDEEVYFVSPDVQADIHAAVQALEYLPLAMGWFSRFSQMDRSRQTRFIAAASASQIELVRAVASSLRLMVQLVYYGHPAVWPAIGYDGPFAHLPEQLSEQRLHFRQLKATRP